MNRQFDGYKSRGQSSPAQGWYDQDHDEWVVVLRGAAVIAYPDGNEAGRTVADLAG